MNNISAPIRMNHSIDFIPMQTCTMIGRAKLIGILVLGLFLGGRIRKASLSRRPRTLPRISLEMESLIQQHRFAEAKTEALEQLKRHPSSVEGYNLLGIIETNQHDYPAAMASFQKALQLSPRSVKTHNNLGNFYLAQQQR